MVGGGIHTGVALTRNPIKQNTDEQTKKKSPPQKFMQMRSGINQSLYFYPKISKGEFLTVGGGGGRNDQYL